MKPTKFILLTIIMTALLGLGIFVLNGEPPEDEWAKKEDGSPPPSEAVQPEKPDWVVNPDDYWGKVVLPAENRLKICMGPKLMSLDPMHITAGWEFPFSDVLSDGLVHRGHDNPAVAEPGVAEKWTSSNDLKTWTFYLRKDAYWFRRTKEGLVQIVRQMTAYDFANSWQRCLDPEATCEYRPMFSDVQIAGARDYEQALASGNKKTIQAAFQYVVTHGFEALDEYTFVVHLQNPSPLMPAQLSFPVFRPVYLPVAMKKDPKTKKETENDAWTRPENAVWSGEYFLAEWTDAHLVLVKNDLHYWWETHEGPDVIEALTPEKYEAIQDDFEQGNIDVVGISCRPQGAMVLANRDKKDIMTFLESRLNYVVVNHNKVTDQRVRQALALSIDRKTLVENVMRVPDKPSGNVVPDGMGYLGVQGYIYDLDGAKSLMALAGYGPQKPFTLTLNHRQRDTEVAIATYLQQAWGVIGVDVKLNVLEARQHSKNLHAAEFEVSVAAWGADYLDPMTYWVLARTGNAYNYGRWSDPMFDDLTWQGFTNRSDIDRVTAYQKAETILRDAAVLIPLAHATAILLYKPYVEGLRPNVLDDHPLRHLRIKRP